MTVTPRISVAGMLAVFGGSASKMNLLTPTGMGPTRRESSSWSCSELERSMLAGVASAVLEEGCARGGGADVGELPLEVLLQRLEALKGDLELVGSIEGRGVVPHGDVEQAHCRRSAWFVEGYT
jgi:hypothetical protein